MKFVYDEKDWIKDGKVPDKSGVYLVQYNVVIWEKNYKRADITIVTTMSYVTSIEENCWKFPNYDESTDNPSDFHIEKSVLGWIPPGKYEVIEN